MKNMRDKFFRIYDKTEVIFALVVIGFSVFLACNEVFSCDFFKNKDLYLNTTDALPIYTKVNYAVECLKNGDWPSWFPHWYCGTSVSQYYPPLTYILLVPLDFLMGNDNAVLQLYMFSGMLCGGMGIWYLFKHYVGRFWGILAGVLYVMLPFFIISFFSWGVIAQIPIVALAPWYLACCLKFYNSEKRYWWLATLALSFVLLTSHVMHGFLIALCIFVSMLVLTVKEKRSFSALMMWGAGAALSAGALGFWWVTGVLPLENPGVPYLSPDAAMDVTANLTWFFPENINVINKFFPQMKNTIKAYFPFIIILVALASIVFIRKQKGKAKTALLFLYVQTVFSFILSFGAYLPLFKYLPLTKQLVPGRVLTQTAIGAAILTAFTVAKLMALIFNRAKGADRIGLIIRAWCLVFVIFISGLVVKEYRYVEEPRKYLNDFETERGAYSLIEDDLSNFQKGRLAWYGTNFESSYAYFAGKYDFNIVSGWNIEGTTLGKYLRYQNAAIYFERSEFLLKKIYDMNVQYCFLNKIEMSWLGDYLEKNDFERIGQVNNIEVFKRSNFSYFMEQKRNALAIGKAANVFTTQHPEFLKGFSARPSDYSEDYFDDFEYIYYSEPEINDMAQVGIFEDQVRMLAKKGKKIFVEFGRTTFPYELFGVYPNDRALEDGFNVSSDDEFDGRRIYTAPDGGRFVELLGLDNALYSMVNSTGMQTLDLIGTKRVEDTDIYFIGGPLSQLKSFAFGYLTGEREFKPEILARDQIISGIFDRIFDEGIYSELRLPDFGAENVEWRADGCDFEYESDTDKRVMASITYTPRWKVYVDGIQIKDYNMENMLVFKLPKGRHEVRMVYESTVYSRIGLGITAVSLVLVAVILVLYKKITGLLDLAAKRFLIYLEIAEGE